MNPARVAVIGCGLIGRRRAAAAAAHPDSELVLCVDTNARTAAETAREFGGRAAEDWTEALHSGDVDVVIVATPNAYLARIGCAALNAGKHVLLEKPMGRNYAEALALAETAERSGRLLKIGFNHRYHPAVARAYELARSGVIGRVINLRARYGHGSRPGCEKEWRADPELAGGGELTDQGVHIADLFHWFAGPIVRAVGVVQTAVWPITPLEDNGFGIVEFENGAVGILHVSMTQWKNLFSLEIHGELGTLAVEGLGGSYGTERLVITTRKLEGGVPEQREERFEGPDVSWAAEWADFVHALRNGSTYWGTPADGVAAMRTIDGIYRSARARSPWELVTP